MKDCIASLLFLGAARLVLGLELDCTELKCYEDVVHVAGSQEKLLAQCLHGIFSGSAPRKASCGKGKDCPVKRCNVDDSNEVMVEESQYRPICSCIRYNSIPSHCYNIPCYRELVALAGNSGGKLRNICHEHLKSTADIRLSDDGLFVSKDAKGRQCQVSILSDNSTLVPFTEYRAACECGVSSKWRRRPELGDYIPWHHEPIYTDVFIHVVVRSPEALFPYNQPGVVEDIFNYNMMTLESVNIKFTIKVVQIIVHRDWASGEGNSEMRRRLHLGDRRDLNLYILERLDSKANKISPIDPNRKIYCTPPFGFPSWGMEEIGPPHQDGCILSLDFTFASAEAPSFVFQELQRWFGHCTTHMRSLPPSRAMMIPVNNQVNNPCEKHKCYREMEFLFGSIDVLAAHCHHNELTRWTSQYQTGGFMIRDTGRGFRDSTCGSHQDSQWVVPASDWEPLCNCIRDSSFAPRWTFTNETLSGAAEDRPIHIDVFVHAIAASRESPMAKRVSLDTEEVQWETECADPDFPPPLLRDFDLRVNALWAQGEDSGDMRESLYKGGSRDLNLYYIEAPQLNKVIVTKKPMTVYCTFPYSSWWAYLAYSEPEHDGCIVAFGALPSVMATSLQHWMGVMNPQERSCRYAFDVPKHGPSPGGKQLTDGWPSYSEAECGPEFSDLDKENMYRLLALNRFVPIEKKRPSSTGPRYDEMF
ncbi:hypothetical protein XA68_13499 [Ophiocordyceps unilateralis]|uniref:Uncharacterized protein n=1 Tax=Ophiocordyceps unilateralis TaxID=268505 RepID=A0A2A9PCG5_OPHUN|nr:hypothetical protein XA68_13499 [Ophiocordyceps unilateralis]